MNLVDIIILVVIALCVIIAITGIVKKKHRCSSCCGCIYSDKCESRKNGEVKV